VTDGDWNFFPQAGYLERFYDGRARRIKGTWFSLANLPLTLASYFSQSQIDFAKAFPWVFLPAGDLTSHTRAEFARSRQVIEWPIPTLIPCSDRRLSAYRSRGGGRFAGLIEASHGWRWKPANT
jgi:hypothetical protein